LSNPTQSRTNLSGCRIVGIAVGSAALVGAIGMGIVGSAGAKEIGSGGGTVTSTACNPVTSLKYKGDATTSDTALATVAVSYSVKSCGGSAVTADVTMWQSTTPGTLVYDAPGSPHSGKFTVAVKANTSYQVKVTVRSAASGDVVGSQTIFAAAVYKGV
jgi:hypothetical protein